MGIRVNKMCGYGLADLGPADPRIDWESPLFSTGLTGPRHLEAYLELLGREDSHHLESSIIRRRREKGERDPEVGHAIAMGSPDGGMESVVCLRPVTASDWHRRDDTLDWLEEAYVHTPHDGMLDHVRVIPHGIWPFSASYMDARTGERLGGEVMPWIRFWTNLPEDKQAEVMEKAPQAADELAAPFGMTHAEAAEHVAPLVPPEVKCLAEYAGLFSAPDVWLQMRPMVYTWWA